MNIAKQILEEATSMTRERGSLWLEALNTASSKGEPDQLWDEEATIFTFEDNSALKFTDNEVIEVVS